MVFLFFALFGMWVAFSGYLTAKFLIMGAVSCLLAVWIASRMRIVHAQRSPLRRMGVRSVIYWPWLAKEIWFSSVSVAVKIWQTGSHVRPVMETISGAPKNDVGKALYGNTITLTPGTLCVDVDGDDITVHSLSSSGIEELKQGDMKRQVESFIKEE